MDRYTGVLGILFIIGVCWALSADRRRIDWRLILTGIFCQVFLALVLLKTSWGPKCFEAINSVFVVLDGCFDKALSFFFGSLMHRNIPVGSPLGSGDPLSANLDTGLGLYAQVEAVFAFKVLASIFFFSLLSAILYYLGVMKWIVFCMAWIMQKTLRTGGAETVSAAGNIFLGQTEAPLFIKPYLERMSRSELLAVMIGGMANIAGGVLVAYVSMLSGYFPNIAGHLIAASVMSAPASLLISKLLIPDDRAPEDMDLHVAPPKLDPDFSHALERGMNEGWELMKNVAKWLLALIFLVELANVMLFSSCRGIEQLSGWNLSGVDSFQELVGYMFVPLAWLMGVPSQDCLVAGTLLGEKTVLNEFFAYADFGQYLAGKPIGSLPVQELSEKTKTILSYALCGFANITSMGIIYSGLGTMAPSRKAEIKKLLWLALLGGSLSTFMTASIAGILQG